ncbi:MAG: hypothetical protein ABW106_13015 [Steroidobacteraceae bacterium]
MKHARLSMIAALLLSSSVVAQEKDPCTQFKWDVTHELAVMKQSPQPLVAAVHAGKVPQLELDKLYSLQLASQADVKFVAKPTKATPDDGAKAGLVRFRTAKAGRYRVSLTSAHWLDVLDGDKAIPSKDFQGQRGCERPRKIVEFELAAEHEFGLQFSGSADAQVIVAITTVTT